MLSLKSYFPIQCIDFPYEDSNLLILLMSLSTRQFLFFNVGSVPNYNIEFTGIHCSQKVPRLSLYRIQKNVKNFICTLGLDKISVYFNTTFTSIVQVIRRAFKGFLYDCIYFLCNGSFSSLYSFAGLAIHGEINFRKQKNNPTLPGQVSTVGDGAAPLTPLFVKNCCIILAMRADTLPCNSIQSLFSRY